MKQAGEGREKKRETATIYRPYIQIIGSNYLFNGVMAAYLSEHAPFRCAAAETLPDCWREQFGNRQENMPALVLIDWRFENREELIRIITSRECLLPPKKTRAALFNTPEDDGVAERAITEGVAGVFPPKTPPDILIRGIHKILEGELWYPRYVLSQYLMGGGLNDEPAGPASKLTHRERQILAELAGGKSNQAIAEALGLRLNTVKSHIYKIYRKINVPNRLQAAFWAARYL